jgi:hypothetical protein
MMAFPMDFEPSMVYQDGLSPSNGLGTLQNEPSEQPTPPSPKTQCMRQLSEIMLHLEEARDVLPPDPMFHVSSADVKQHSYLMSIKYSHRASLEQLFKVAQLLVDIYPQATDLALAPPPTVDCSISGCVHALELPACFPADKFSIQSNEPRVDYALLSNTISCHSRLLDILDLMMGQALICLKVTLAETNHEEPNFDIPELRIGSFVLPPQSASTMLTTLLLDLQSGLVEKSTKMSTALSTIQTKESRVLLLQLEMLGERAEDKISQLRNIKDAMANAGHLK